MLEEQAMSESKSDSQGYEAKIIPILMLYLIALVATFIDKYVGIVAFICVTITVIAIHLMLTILGRNKK